jgi:putative phosphoesterase
MGSPRLRIGLISDTHGLMRPEALLLLRGCDHIVHGGDIGGTAILDALRGLAPVTAVRGNNDHGAWADALAETATLEFGGVSIHVIHDLSLLAIEPAAVGFHVVVSGHSHKPVVERRGDVLYVNPGSAGPRRFRLPISLGEIVIENRAAAARIVEIELPAQ